MSAARRVVHVTTTDMSLALLLGPQLRAFKAAGYDVVGVSAPGPWVTELEAHGIVHMPLRHATRAWAPHRDLGALAELRALFRSLAPAIVHTHNPKPGVYGRLAARWAGVPAIVNTVHGLYAQPEDRFRRRAAVYAAERFAARFSHAELVQNPEDLETLARLGVPRSRLVQLGNGIDLERFAAQPPAARSATRASLGIADDEVLVLAVGRLVVEKGYREMFAAARRVTAVQPRVRFVVVGPTDDDKGDALKREELAEAARSGVTILGMRDDVDDLYAAADVYVLASHREGFPRSAMEAAATGLPIVATNVRGCRQVVDDGRSGILFARGDVDALADALLALSRDESLRRTMGAAAVLKAKRDFDQQRVIDLTLDVYDRLLGSPRAAVAVSS